MNAMNVSETVKKLDDPGTTPAMASAAATDGADTSRSYRWKWLVEKDTSLLSLNLPADLKLEDFVVRVDGKRRLTITDRHKPTPGGKAAPRLNKTFQFQLPKTANLDAITGCFDGAELTLTVPSGRKRQQQPAAVTVVAAKEEEEPKAKAEREKKLIDTAVAAFTLGVLFSHKLFSSRN